MYPGCQPVASELAGFKTPLLLKVNITMGSPRSYRMAQGYVRGLGVRLTESRIRRRFWVHRCSRIANLTSTKGLSSGTSTDEKGQYRVSRATETSGGRGKRRAKVCCQDPVDPFLYLPMSVRLYHRPRIRRHPPRTDIPRAVWEEPKTRHTSGKIRSSVAGTRKPAGL